VVVALLPERAKSLWDGTQKVFSTRIEIARET